MLFSKEIVTFFASYWERRLAITQKIQDSNIKNDPR